MTWYVYMVRCRDGSLYCGVTKDVFRRIDEHNNSTRGSRYTRARRPVALAWRKRQELQLGAALGGQLQPALRRRRRRRAASKRRHGLDRIFALEPENPD